MRSFLFLVFICALSVACAQMLPGAKPVSSPMADSEGKPVLMDFSINLVGLKDANMPFSVFSDRPLMIYYFGPNCPHCQRTYGGVQQVAKEYEQKGLASIAISVGNASRMDLLKFMDQHKASIPFFQDTDQTFGKNYGDGYVPRLYLVQTNGQVYRYTSTDSEGMKEVKADIERLFGIK
ncbi:MAG: TlpA family protein disulfide reductase [Fibromonadaceae bacterium]|nr:TlpA family protein disulfide reductase [Fibromonadaceae bacterium]